MGNSIYKKLAAGNSAMLSAFYGEKAGMIYLACRLLAGFDSGAAKTAKETWTVLLDKVKGGEITDSEKFDAEALKTAASLCRDLTAKSNPKAFSPSADTARKAEEAAADIFPGNVTSAMRYVSEALSGVKPAERFAAVLSLLGMKTSDIAEIIKLDEAQTQAAAAAGTEALCKNLEAAGKAKYSIDIPKRGQIKELFTRALTEYKAPDGAFRSCFEAIQSFAVQKSNRRFAIAIGILGAVIIGLFIAKIAMSRNSKTAENAVTAASGEILATIDVENYGQIRLRLYPDKAPITVENFVSLAESGFYDGLTFHRIEEGFVIQGGDPNGNGSGGADKDIKGEFSANGIENDLSHTRGAISMARNSFSMDSASSQFFIVHQDSTFLDGQYACFGYVTEGMDVVDAMVSDAHPIDSSGSILSDEQPVIKSVTIERQ